MTTLREQYKELAKQHKIDVIENYCQKIIDECVKKIWQKEEYYKSRFRNDIFNDLDPKYYCIKQISTHYSEYKVSCVHIPKPNTFFQVYKYANIDNIINLLNKIISDKKFPKDFKLVVHREKRLDYEYNKEYIYINLTLL